MSSEWYCCCHWRRRLTRSASRRRLSFVILIHPKDHQSVTVSSSHTHTHNCASVWFFSFFRLVSLSVSMSSRCRSVSLVLSPHLSLSLLSLTSFAWMADFSLHVTWATFYRTTSNCIYSLSLFFSLSVSGSLLLYSATHCAACDLIEDIKGQTLLFSFFFSSCSVMRERKTQCKQQQFHSFNYTRTSESASKVHRYLHIRTRCSHFECVCTCARSWKLWTLSLHLFLSFQLSPDKSNRVCLWQLLHFSLSLVSI